MIHKRIPYRRMTRRTEIARKSHIITDVFCSTVDVPGRYNKGKVSCSCPRCRANKAHYSDSNSIKSAKVSDRRKVEHINSLIGIYEAELETA